MPAIAFGGNNTAGPIDVATACNAHGGSHGRLDFESETFITHSLRADGFDASEDGTGRGTPLIAIQNALRGKGQNGLGVAEGPMFTLDNASQHAVAFKRAQIGKPYDRTRYVEGQAGTLSAYDPEAIAKGMDVRRLTPAECEKLQGFDPGYTAIAYRGKPRPSSSRERGIVAVVRWIGERIAMVEELLSVR